MREKEEAREVRKDRERKEKEIERDICGKRGVEREEN